MISAAIYARVSTGEQHTENQLPELREYAQRNGWTAIEYLEEASGKPGAKRPVLAQLLEDARQHKFQVVMVWKIDRFGRSIKDFVKNIEILDQAGVRFLTTSQPIDTDQRSPIGKMMMALLMIFAEFERDLIVERVQSGVTRYRDDYDHGKIGILRNSKSGKNLPQGRPVKIMHRGRAAEMHAQGIGYREIGRVLHVPESSIRRALKLVAA